MAFPKEVFQFLKRYGVVQGRMIVIQQESYVSLLREKVSDLLGHDAIGKDMDAEALTQKKVDDSDKLRMERRLPTDQSKSGDLPSPEYLNQNIEMFEGDLPRFARFDLVFCKTVRTPQITSAGNHRVGKSNHLFGREIPL
jgi:hypothetical protein